MGIVIRREEVQRALGAANDLALLQGDELAVRPDLGAWRRWVESLQQEGVPRTYLAVAAVLLTARAMHSSDFLDVRDIKAGISERGYSASSVAMIVAAFAKEQRIDLRAKSTQPMNNQPFTYKARIEMEMGAKAQLESQWRDFYTVVERINDASPREAHEALALLFYLCGQVDSPALQIWTKSCGKAAVDAIAAGVADYVDTISGNGKVGQAFVAAVFDVLYGPDAVLLGAMHDPDAATPGDVHLVGSEGDPWLWAEAKQRSITSGDIIDFLHRVSAGGGERVAYFALANHRYSSHIEIKKTLRAAGNLDMGLNVFESAADALEYYLPLASGSYSELGGRLLERMHARLREAGCSGAEWEAFEGLVAAFSESP